MQRKYLLIATALGECGTGLALLGLPAVVFRLLLGVDSPAPEAVLVGRVTGGALLAIGVACWLDRSDRRPASGLLTGVLIYDLAAAVLLACAGSALDMAGVAVWPAVGLHGALALWSAYCLCIEQVDSHSDP